MRIVILYSGGLDSRIMYHYAKVYNPDSEIICVYYKHGAESEEMEIKNLPPFVNVKTVDWLDDACLPVSKKSDPFAGNIYIPGRNLVFATLAACQYLPTEIWMGTLADECNSQATDKNGIFAHLFEETANYVLSPFSDGVELVMPFVREEWTKREMVSWALDHGLTELHLKNTVSCWHADGKPCGKCKQCVKRYLVMLLNGIQEPYNPFEHAEAIDLMFSYLNCIPSNADEEAVKKNIKDCIEQNLFTEEQKDLLMEVGYGASYIRLED